ncbi:MAG: C4-dicarboxylate transporter DctA [Rickettsiales bacterium]
MTSASSPQEASPTKKALHRSIYVQVIVAIILGIGFGHFHPEMAATMKPLADGFIKLIKMIIGPIIFCTIVHGVAGSDNLRQVGTVGVKALSYFMFMTTFAMLIGLVVVNIQQPGVGMNIGSTVHEQEYVAADKGNTPTAAKSHNSAVDFVLNIIPKTMSSAFTEGNILQVLFISLLCAFALAGMGEKGKPVVHGIELLSAMFFRIVNMIVKLAPIGAFGAMAFTIGEHGIESLIKLFAMMLGFYATCILFVGVVLWAVMRVVGLSLWSFLKYIKEEIFIVVGTCSSETVLPQMVEKLTKLGCKRSVAGMVIPTGYSFNLDGTAIYLTMGAMFIAQATNTPMGLGEQLSLLALLIVASKGAAAVSGGSFIVLAATLSTMDLIPPALLTIALAQIFAIHRFMSEAISVTNLIGNGVATLFVSKWEKALDMNVARKMLSER